MFGPFRKRGVGGGVGGRQSYSYDYDVFERLHEFLRVSRTVSPMFTPKGVSTWAGGTGRLCVSGTFVRTEPRRDPE